MRKWHSRRDTRKIHRWGAFLVSIPFLIVIITGLLLQLKKEVEWIQPVTEEVAIDTLSIKFSDILSISQGVFEAQIKDWSDIDRLDVRPEKGIVKVRAKNRWEIQIDLERGTVLKTAYRRSDIIEQLHDGSWFHDAVKLWLFFPSGIVVLILWLSGMYLFFVPILAKGSRKS
jgi:uncharacterized iron-regulated membrane protein